MNHAVPNLEYLRLFDPLHTGQGVFDGRVVGGAGGAVVRLQLRDERVPSGALVHDVIVGILECDAVFLRLLLRIRIRYICN